MAQNPDTKYQIIDLAETFLLTLGFDGFSYAHISRELQITNAAVHYHFPTKVDLGIAIIQKERRQFSDWASVLRMEKMTFAAKLDAFCGIFSDFLKAEGHVCLGSTLEHDFNKFPESMQNETRAFIADILNWLENLMREGHAAGAFSFSCTPEEQAVFILSALQGALLMVRATDASVLDTAINRIRETVIK